MKRRERKREKKKLYSIKIDNRFKLKTVLCEKRIMFVNILRDVEKRNEGKQRISQIFNRKLNYFHNYFVFTNKMKKKRVCLQTLFIEFFLCFG